MFSPSCSHCLDIERENSSNPHLCSLKRSYTSRTAWGWVAYMIKEILFKIFTLGPPIMVLYHMYCTSSRSLKIPVWQTLHSWLHLLETLCTIWPIFHWIFTSCSFPGNSASFCITVCWTTTVSFSHPVKLF